MYSERLDQLKNEIEKLNITELQIDSEDLYDQFCDPNNPVQIKFNDISAAAYRIKGGVEITPCTVIIFLSKKCFSFKNYLIKSVHTCLH